VLVRARTRLDAPGLLAISDQTCTESAHNCKRRSSNRERLSIRRLRLRALAPTLAHALDLQDWLKRVEAARAELGWSQRDLAKQAGLRSETAYGGIAKRLKDNPRHSPSVYVLEAINRALASAGYPIEHAPIPRPVETGPIADAREVVQTLVEDGVDRETAKRAVGSVLFDDPSLAGLALFRAARRVLAEES
jgi:transcriptional regulator with XRE-family HTH domain